jgi:hemoglobin/transferrin/lactoferrin receptor protein
MKYLIAAAMLAAGVAQAQSEQELETVVVTATRIAAPTSETTFTGSYFGRTFLEENLRRNIPDALSLVPGVLSQKTTYGHGSPFIRGQTGRANLLLVDGVRLNNSVWRSGPVQYWNTVDAYAIERVELIRSQGSVPFGSDAIGGTLNAFTRSSAFRKEAPDQLFANGDVRYEYRSNGEGSGIARVEGAAGKGGSWGLNGGVTYKDFGDIEDSSVGEMQNTGYDETDWDVRYDLSVDDGTTLTMAYQDVDQDDVWRWHRTIYSPGWKKDGHVAAAGTWVANTYDQGRSLGYVKVDSLDPGEGEWLSHFTATVSYQELEDSEFQDRRSDESQAVSSTRYQQLQTADVRTLGIDLALESPVGPGNLVYGLDYYRDDVDSHAERNTGRGFVFRPASRPVADDSTYDLLGIYAQYLWQATEALRVEGGARYTRAEAYLGKRFDTNVGRDVSSTREWDDTVLSLRAIQRLTDEWSVYGGASQAFRAPNLVDLSGNTTSRSGIEAGGSVNLDPEQYVTYELGTRHSGEDLALTFAVFYTDIADIITDVPVPQASSMTITQNGRDGHLYGFEAEASWRLADQWLLSGYLGWQEGKTQTAAYIGGPEVEEHYSRALPLSGSVALRWNSASERFWCEGRVLASEDATRLSLADISDTQRIPTGGTPRYFAGMLHAGWRVGDHLDLTLGLENVTDEDYRVHGSGNNEPGFNAIAAIKASW